MKLGKNGEQQSMIKLCLSFKIYVTGLKQIVHSIIFLTGILFFSSLIVLGQEQKITDIFKDAIKCYETGEKEKSLNLITQLLKDCDIKDSTVIFHNRHYNLEAVGLNIIAHIYLDLKMLDEAEKTLKKIVADYSETKILWPFSFEKEGDYYCKAGPLALDILYDLYSGKYGAEKKNLSITQEIGHKLLKEFPTEKLVCGDGYWTFIDHSVTKKILAAAESIGDVSFLKEGKQILSESKNPLCRICVLDAFAMMNRKKGNYKKAIEIYNSIVKQFPYYNIEYDSPFYEDPYRSTSPFYASLAALEEIAQIYLYRIKDREKAFEVFGRAITFAEEEIQRKAHNMRSSLDYRIERYRLATEGRSLPEFSIVEDKGVVGQYNHIAWHPDSKKLAYIAYDGGIYEKNLEKEGCGNFIIGPANAIQYSSDGKNLMYIWSGEIWFYSLVNGLKSKITSKELEGWVGKASLSPGDSLILFRISNKLYLLNIKTMDKDLIGGGIFNPSWSPDGNTIIGIQGSQIAELDIKTKELKLYSVPDVHGDSSPSFSPDGQYFVYSTSGIGKILIVNRDKGSFIQLPLWYLGGGYLPKWSPDGQYIAFVGAENKIFVAPVPEGL